MDGPRETSTAPARHGPTTRWQRPSWPVVVPVAAAACVAVLAAIGISAALDVPIADVVEDPAATTGANPLVGALSNLGILLWWAGATVALFAAYVLHRSRADRSMTHFLLVGGLLTAYLAIDDLFLIHDELVPASPLPQPVFLALAGLGFAAYLVTFRRLLASTEWLLVLLAGALFGASLALDVASDLGKYLDAWETSSAMIFVEDTMKWLGIVAWTTYLVRLSASAVVASRTDHSATGSRDLR